MVGAAESIRSVSFSAYKTNTDTGKFKKKRERERERAVSMRTSLYFLFLPVSF
jgi:hypothetical protein